MKNRPWGGFLWIDARHSAGPGLDKNHLPDRRHPVPRQQKRPAVSEAS
jgi:hypothetical protein